MKTIFADYNAATESGRLRLNLVASQEGIAKAQLRLGDWAWLSDGEVVVGARLEMDERYGIVGSPDWDTLVHLDDEGSDDLGRIRAELNTLNNNKPRSDEDEPRVFQLLTQMENVLPPSSDDTARAPFHFRRALALRNMSKLDLALLEMKEARHARPNDPLYICVYLELLRLKDLPSAIAEVEIIIESSDVPALVLSACINVLATQADQVPDNQLESIAARVLGLCRRFDQAPDLEQAEAPLQALSYVNRGFLHLRAGRVGQARQAFEHAHQIYPTGPMLDQLARIKTYDQHAREVARSVREIAERWVRSITAAA